MIFNFFKPGYKLQKKEYEIELEIQKIINLWDVKKIIPEQRNLEKLVNERTEIIIANQGNIQNIFHHTNHSNFATIEFNRIKKNETWNFHLIGSNLEIELIDHLTEIKKNKVPLRTLDNSSNHFNFSNENNRSIDDSKNKKYSLGDALDENNKNIRYSLRAPSPEISENWQSIFSEDFKKCLRTIDKKLKGRILEAVLQISENPTTLQGDTVKPLRNELAGCWRYRIGDYRLIYKPIKEVFKILFLDFGSRGGIYE